MVSTRSKTAQARIENYAERDTNQEGKEKERPSPRKAVSKPSAPSPSSRKRKSSTEASRQPPAKRARPPKPALKRSDSAQPETPTKILINRAPVLHLWAACVTHVLYPSLPWSTCLSTGSAISTICAVAKGRSVGTISERDDSEAAQRKRAEAKRKQKDLESIHVLQFNLKLRDGLALVGSEQNGKPPGEEALRRKFGEEVYERVKEFFDDALQSWKHRDEELNKSGFRFYEEFRPTVSGGQKGWGRKGELDLEKIKSVVRRE